MKALDRCVMVCGLVLIVVAVLLVLPGCSTTTQSKAYAAARDAAESTRSLNDAKLTGSEILYCDGQSTGAVAREYGDDRELWESYWSHCNRIRGAGHGVEVPPFPDVETYDGD